MVGNGINLATRLVMRAPIAVCNNGHVASVDSSQIEEVLQYENSCGHWVWIDANFCHECCSPVGNPADKVQL
jgi:hypothetical protein